MKTITLEGVEYEIRQLKMGDIEPLFNSEESIGSFDMARIGITVNGEPIGEAFNDLSLPTGQKLMNLFNELNASEGND